MTAAMTADGSAARTWLVNAIVLLSIFCFIQILPLEAEVQPFGAAVAALFLVLYPSPLRRTLAGYFGILAAALALTLARHGITGEPPLAAALTTFLAISAPVLVFGALFLQTERIKPALVLASLGAWLFVGITQTFLPQLQRALGLDALLARLISRYAEEAATEMNRGASLLAPEPSYAAHVVFLFFVAILYFVRRRSISPAAAAFGLAAIAALAYVNRSGSLAMVAFAFVCSYCVLRLAHRRDLPSFGALAAAVCIPVAALFYVASGEAEEFRAAVVLAAFLEDLLSGQLDVVSFTTGFGSIRTISVLTAGYSVLTGHYLGEGLGSWSYRFIDQLFALGVNPWELFFFYSKGALIDIKPYSHLAILAFDLGLVGIALDVALLWSALRICAAGRLLRQPLAASIVLVSLVAIVGNTLVSLPAYWITLALGLDLARKEPPA